MAYTPQYYPGSTSVGINRRKHMTGSNLEKIRDLPATDALILMTSRTTYPLKSLEPTQPTNSRPAGRKKGKRGVKGGFRVKPSEREAEECCSRWPEFRTPKEIRQAEKAARRAEAERSAKFLGVEELIWLDYPDGEVPAGQELVRRLVQVIRQEKPDAVLTVDPWLTYEAHSDHLHTGMAAAQACLFSSLPLFATMAPHQVSMVAFYATSRPNTIINVDATWEEKLTAIKMHESQFAGVWDQYAAYFDIKARELAQEHIFSYGEAFKVLTPQHLHFFVDTERR